MSEERFIYGSDKYWVKDIENNVDLFPIDVLILLNEQDEKIKELEEENEELKEIHQKGSKSCEKWKQHKEAQIQQLEKENTNLIELAEELGVKIEVVDDE